MTVRPACSTRAADGPAALYRKTPKEVSRLMDMEAGNIDLSVARAEGGFYVSRRGDDHPISPREKSLRVQLNPPDTLARAHARS
jgi:hypothetical protein